MAQGEGQVSGSVFETQEGEGGLALTPGPGRRADWGPARQLYLAVAGTRLTKQGAAAASGLDAAAVEECWRDLLHMGLIRPVDGDSGGLHEAVHPDAALAALLDRQRTFDRAHLARSAAFSSAVDALAEVFRPAAARASAPATLEQFVDPATRVATLLDLNVAARECIDSLHPGPMPDTQVLRRSLVRDQQLLDRGIRLRALYPLPLLNTPQHARYLRDLTDLGVTVRLVDHAPHHLLVYDRHTALLTAPGDPSYTMIKVTGLLTSAYNALYEDFWARGIPMTGAEAEDQRVRGTLERTIVRLLLKGYQDDQIAHTLGITRRTVQRRVNEVMKRLDARTRAQLGYRLGRIGRRPAP